MTDVINVISHGYVIDVKETFESWQKKKIWHNFLL